MKRLFNILLVICLMLISISETEAIQLAKELAGCGDIKQYQIRAQLKNDQWIMIVSTVIWSSPGWKAYF